MNSLIRKFFQTKGGGGRPPFQEVLFLSEHPELSWEEISERAPDLPRSWYELSRISPPDRVEFTRDFWINFLPYDPQVTSSLSQFFDQLDDVGVVLSRFEEEEPLKPELVYSLGDGSSFFRGNPAASEGDLEEVKHEIEVPLPRDYLSFLKIHNGFGKLSEMGLLPVEEISMARRRVIDLFLKSPLPLRSGIHLVDPSSLVPFYESLGLASYQCFFIDWYPKSEMGNVYLSGLDYTISDTQSNKSATESLAFPSFLEWLVAYLEGADLSW